jgi:putative lipoprotein
MDPKIVDQENAFLAALATVETWEIRGERAQLRSVDGSLAVDLISAVSGTAMIRSKTALPPDAILQVQLQDVSRADAAALVVGEMSQPLQGQDSLVPFAVSFDPAEIDERMSYTVRATVRSGDELLFTTTQSYPVLTGEGGQFGIELRLEAAGQ